MSRLITREQAIVMADEALRGVARDRVDRLTAGLSPEQAAAVRAEAEALRKAAMAALVADLDRRIATGEMKTYPVGDPRAHDRR